MEQKISFLFTAMTKIDLEALNLLASQTEPVLCGCVYCEQNGKHRLDYNVEFSQNLEIRKQEFVLEEFVEAFLCLHKVVQNHHLNMFNVDVKLRHVFKSNDGYQFLYIPITKKKKISTKKVLFNLLRQLRGQNRRISTILSELKTVSSDEEIILYLEKFKTPARDLVSNDIASEGETTLLPQEAVDTQDQEMTTLLGVEFKEEQLLMQSEDDNGETTILSQHTTAFLQNDSSECETTFLSEDISYAKSKEVEGDGDYDLYLLRVCSGECIHINKNVFLIGKDINSMDYVLGNESVSRNHASVICEDRKFYLSDNGSTNGTTIEGIRVKIGERVELGDGDIISLGNEVFQVLLERK